MDFQEHTFQHEGVSTKYYEQGSGEPMVFLHGGGVRVLTYKKVLDELSRKFQVIAPDLPCFGSATVPREVWGLQEYGSFIIAFISYLNIRNVTLIGHSFGGGVALAVGAKSRNVKRVILIDSAGINNGYSCGTFLYKFYIEKTVYDIIRYRDIVQLFLIAKDFVTNRITKFSQWSQIMKIVKNCLFNDFAGIHGLRAPTLILWGREDEIFPPNLAQRMSEEIPNSTLKLVDGNHDWSLFENRKLVGLITQWLGHTPKLS